jgi:iron(III) transport system substrate-binding protein
MRNNLPRIPVACLPLLLSPLWLACGGCWSAAEQEVVVYAALDREFSEPILQDFEAATGIRVLTKYDVESTKTVGLVNALIQERNRPRCDLFWNNEILHTLRLDDLDMLDTYASPLAADYPPAYRSPQGTWYGFAARIRVLIVNTQLVPETERPNSIQDLIDPKWQGKVGIAKPLFGTTATHAAVLFAHWGDERAEEFFARLKNNAQVLAGNKQVALSVAKGELAFGLTDTDDAIIEQDKGMPVAIVYPDQGEGELGALFIPNTLALIKAAPNGQSARRLVDFLLSPEVEARLAEGRSAQFPLNTNVTTGSRAAGENPIRHMPVDFAAAADKWEDASQFLRERFTVD